MKWNLPLSVKIDGRDYQIRNKCDYRVVLDVISALNDNELEANHRFTCALFIFYEDLVELKDFKTAILEMIKIITLGEIPKVKEIQPRLMDWEHDFLQLAPPISRVLGYSVRDVKNYTHWYDFIGAYMEIGSDCIFTTIITIRSKRIEGKQLDKHESEFLRKHADIVNLPQCITEEEAEWLNSEW